ncbi:MAG TPA: hypothetical protein VHO03_10875 [Ignavibacteriales bacterium]|nr:hypothetical protein [Ignavibacteriales bacterium]
MPLDLTLFIVLLGTFGLWIFGIKRELFIRPKSFKLILIISIVLFIMAYVLPVFDAFKNKPVNILKLPILALFLYRILRAFFRKMNDREPKDTFWVMHTWEGIWADTVFNISFWLIHGILFMLLLAEKI